MYLSFYRLKHKPFQISTDPRFLWLGEKHEEALATLRYGVLDNKGFLLLTGDVGTGKTTLINALLRTLDENTFVAFIRDPALDPLDFFQYTAHAFGMKGSNINSKGSFLIQFEEFLLDAYEKRRKVLLIIDEAQRMSQELLEEVRLLSNIEREEGKLLNIFFVGQMEFNDIIHHPANRAIRQRITINYNIEELSEVETRQYIKHRLEVASSKEDIGFFTPVQKKENGEYVKQGMRLPLPEVREEIFTADAITEVYNFSQGYPRLINIICDRALLTGFVEESKTITLKHIKECVKELEIPHNKEMIAEQQIRSDSSLRNSLAELNREFEERRKLETSVERTHEKSPRELIKRLENGAEKHHLKEEPPQQNEEIREDVVHDNKADLHSFTNQSSLVKHMLKEHESVTQDSGTFDDTNFKEAEAQEEEYSEGVTDNQSETPTEKSSREILDDLARFAKEDVVEKDTVQAKDVPFNANSFSKPILKEKRVNESKRLKNIIFIVGVICLSALAYFNYTKDNIDIAKRATPADSTPATSIPDILQKKGSPIKDEVASVLTQSNAQKNAKEVPASDIVDVANTKNVKSSTSNILANQTSQGGQKEGKNGDQDISLKIKQLKSLITFEKISIPFSIDADLPDPKTLDSLNNLVDSLLTHSSFQVNITYFSNNSDKNADKTPIYRANAVKSYLMGRGLAASRIAISNKQTSNIPSPSKDSNSSNNERLVEVDVVR